MRLFWQLEYGFSRSRKREFIVFVPSLPPVRRGMLALTATRFHGVVADFRATRSLQSAIPNMISLASTITSPVAHCMNRSLWRCDNCRILSRVPDVRPIISLLQSACSLGPPPQQTSHSRPRKRIQALAIRPSTCSNVASPTRILHAKALMVVHDRTIDCKYVAPVEYMSIITRRRVTSLVDATKRVVLLRTPRAVRLAWYRGASVPCCSILPVGLGGTTKRWIVEVTVVHCLQLAWESQVTNLLNVLAPPHLTVNGEVAIWVQLICRFDPERIGIGLGVTTGRTLVTDGVLVHTLVVASVGQHSTARMNEALRP
jgi:hypothetical protein